MTEEEINEFVEAQISEFKDTRQSLRPGFAGDNYWMSIIVRNVTRDLLSVMAGKLTPDLRRVDSG